MFAIVRTGGKQYRVAPGDKIVVEKLAGNAGDSVDLTDVLFAGEGSELKSTDGLTVGASGGRQKRKARPALITQGSRLCFVRSTSVEPANQCAVGRKK